MNRITCLLFPVLLLHFRAAAEPVPFRRHDINPDSAYCACAVMDVNRDGTPDIVSGGYWYEGPQWKRHFLRQVQMIRGRYDDYSNLPLDVNGDGWLDLVSCNWRSQSLYWVEHPGPTQQPWKKHVIDTPGAMETGRLADVDSDGRLDVLPNGTRFAAWWQLQRRPRPAGGYEPVWLRHDLPVELAGHGVGAGDIDGDGRTDLVGPRGWLQAPAGARRGRWIWRPEFHLHHDAGIPILVHDVDQDGDADLIWGRGHRTGLYWMEQQRDGKTRRWTKHAIDTSWSQAHSLLLADIDGDGKDELVAGKRYMGHDGKDPGEYDPLVICWYKFQPATRTWRRHWISRGGPAGVGLDPKAADVDGDGDIDLVVAGRSGLYLLENLRVGPPGVALPAEPKPPAYSDHTQLLVVKTAAGKQQAVQTPAHWAQRRWHILQGMQAAMGPLPDPTRRVPLDVQIVEQSSTQSYVRQRITYASEPGDRVPAWLLIPKKLDHPVPAVLCLHPTSPLGKDQVCGLGGKPSRFYAHELAQRGFVCLAPDYPSFGEYKNYNFDADAYQSGTMKAIWNNIRALDLLESLPEVDGDRIGAIGHSLGGHNALFTAPFDLRLKAVVTSCGFTALARYYGGNLKGWTSPRYMPLIAQRFGSDPDRVPFDFHEVLAAIAPRPVFVSAPLEDSNFDVEGVREVVSAARGVYRLLGADQQLHVVHPDCGHDFPEDVRQAAYRWLEMQLKKAK